MINKNWQTILVNAGNVDAGGCAHQMVVVIDAAGCHDCRSAQVYRLAELVDVCWWLVVVMRYGWVVRLSCWVVQIADPGPASRVRVAAPDQDQR